MTNTDHKQRPAIQLDKIITIYGRKAVLEALEDPALECHALHWANTNKATGIARNILEAAQTRGVLKREHTRETLSRISKNGKQDQGVALDILCPAFQTTESLAARGSDSSVRVLALDGLTNPQNVGMTIRSALAGGIDAILYPRKGVAAMGPLVIKASVGTVFRAPIVYCDTLAPTLQTLRTSGFQIASLEGGASTSVFDYRPSTATVFVLGNETEGVSPQVSRLADTHLNIPMADGVESLNVAVAASLIAYANRFR